MTFPNRSLDAPSKMSANPSFTASRSRLGMADLLGEGLIGERGLALGRMKGEGTAGGVRCGDVFAPGDGGPKHAPSKLLSEPFFDGLAYRGVFCPAGDDPGRGKG